MIVNLREADDNFLNKTKLMFFKNFLGTKIFSTKGMQRRKE